jgi:hypothetical protein
MTVFAGIAESTNRLLLADHGKNGLDCGSLEPGL